MILEANGTTLKWFHTFSTRKELPKKIGVSISGGTDSSLTLYCLCKSLLMHNRENEVCIYPYNLNMLDYKWPELSKLPTTRCYEIISEMFPSINFPEGLVMKDAWFNSGGGGTYAKQKTMRKYRDLFKKEFNISVVITGSTRNPPKGTSKRLDDLISSDPNLAVREGKEYESRPGPFCSVDKKFLAEIYEQENLMNDLFPNTVSCTNISKIEPCKKCYWCEEKKWAFGMYDGCLT
tara:strand:+ start:1898 stop:2602 length:705 start_codon:yes stop_codon:yes gene_type:complete